MSADIWINAGAALAGGLLGGAISWIMQRRQFRHELKLLREEHKTAYAAEDTVRRLLLHKGYTDRSLNAIRKQVGGYDNNLDELRLILLRAGAFRSKEGTEAEGFLDEKWRLYERNDEFVAKVRGGSKEKR